MPRIDSRKCSLDGTKGKNKTDLSTSSKWQIDLIFVVEGSPARCVSERSKGGDYAPGDSKGHSPWRAFGDFPRIGKVTPGWRGGAPSWLGQESSLTTCPLARKQAIPTAEAEKEGIKKRGDPPSFFKTPQNRWFWGMAVRRGCC